MVMIINEALNRFKVPSYKKIHITLLDDEVVYVENAMFLINDSWVKIGVAILLDGWKHARNHFLVNIIAMFTIGAMILKVVNF